MSGQASRSQNFIQMFVFVCLTALGLMAIRYPGPSASELELFGQAAGQRSLLWHFHRFFSPLGAAFGADEIAAFRSGAVICFVLLAWLVYRWTSRLLGVAGGVTAAGLLILTPRAVAAGMQAGEYPALALTTLLAASLLERTERSRWFAVPFALCCGIGFALSSWFALSALCLVIWSAAGGRWAVRWRSLAAAAAATLVLPILLNPLWWSSPAAGYAAWIAGSLGRSVYSSPVLYFGRLFAGGLPWHYVIVILVAGMPVVLAVLAIAGKLVSVTPRYYPSAAGFGLTVSTLWILSAMTGRFPAADGLAFFLPLLACDSIMAAHTLHFFRRRLASAGVATGGAAVALIFALLFTPPAIVGARLWPCLGSHYSPVVGFLPGAGRLGLQVCFDSSPLNTDFIRTVNDHMGPGTTIRAAGIAESALPGLRAEITTSTAEPSDAVLLLNSPGTWSSGDSILFHTTNPVVSVERSGVVLIGLFETAGDP
ncbi:hypothetical protein ACFL4X_00950 [Gemmatimonadota bacterium]